MFQDIFAEKIKKETHVLYSITFSENHDFFMIVWKNIVEPDRP